MPLWYEYRDINNEYVCETKVKDPSRYKLTECYAPELPENSAFTIRGIRRTRHAQSST